MNLNKQIEEILKREGYGKFDGDKTHWELTPDEIESATQALLKAFHAELLRMVPEKKYPHTKDEKPNFTEPIVAESINTSSSVEPWVNKGFNQCIDLIMSKVGGERE